MSKFEFQDRFCELEVASNKFKVNITKFPMIVAAWEKRSLEIIEQAKTEGANEATIKDLYFDAFKDILNDENAGKKIWGERQFDYLDAIDLLYWIKDEITKFRRKETDRTHNANAPQLNRAQRRAAVKH